MTTSDKRLKSVEQHEQNLDLLAIHLAAGSDLIMALADSDCLNEYEPDDTPGVENGSGSFCLAFIVAVLGFALAFGIMAAVAAGALFGRGSGR